MLKPLIPSQEYWKNLSVACVQHDASKRPSAGELVTQLHGSTAAAVSRPVLRPVSRPASRLLDFGLPVVTESDLGVKSISFEQDDDFYDLDIDNFMDYKVEAFGAAGLAPRCTNLFSFTDALHLFHASIFTLFRFLFCFVRSSWYHGNVARGDAEAKLKVRIHKIYFY